MKNIFVLFILLLTHPICKGQTDQTIIYGTYLGGSENDSENNGVIDAKQGYWIAGSSTSSYDIPISNNAFQSSFAGNVDGYISIFSISGSLEYSSYIGGSGYDNIASIQFLEENNGFAVAGYTNSTDFQVTPNAYQTDYQGGQKDGYIARVAQNGELLWSTYFGGAEFDEIKDMAVDAAGAVYIVGRTNSANLATDGVYQLNNEGLDAFLAKFDQNGNLSWCTYFGDVGDESFNGVDISPDGLSVYCGGYTNSTSNIAHNGWQNTLGGYSDATVASFAASDGTLNWSTYYGGTNNEQCADLVVTENGMIYFTGITQSTSNIASVGAHQENLDGYSDAFLVCLDSNGNRQWATYFGGDDAEDFPELTVQNQDILLYGYSSSSNNIAFGNPIYDGSLHVGEYIAKFDGTGQFIWGTYISVNGPGNYSAFVSLPNSQYFVGAGAVESGFDFPDIITPDAYQLTGNGMADLIFTIFSDNTLSTREIPFYPLKIYPNPATSFVYIEIPQNLKDNLNLEIYDAMGKRISRKSMTAGAAGIDISGLSSGVYILIARTGKEIYRSKLIVE